MDLCSFCYGRKNFSLNWSCTSFDDLPDGLVVDILSRLPVKTIVQSTSINKLWYSLIKHPSFISVHLSCSIPDPSKSYILIIPEPFSTSFFVYSDNNNVITRHPNFNIPFQTSTGTYGMIGACNGLLCLTDLCFSHQYCHDIYMLNPFIQKYRRIGVESSCYPDLIDQIDMADETGIICASFWYCEIEKDYKIFRMILRYDDDARTIALRRFEMYSLNAGRWKVMEGMDALPNYVDSAPVFVNGCLYWLTSSDSSLQCYDLKEKELYNIRVPAAILTSDLCTGLLAKDGSVAVWCTESDFINRTYGIYLTILEKSIGGQFQWKELFHYESDAFINPSNIGFSANGRLILAVDCDDGTKSIVALDIDKSCAVEKKLALDFLEESTMAFNVLESLVLFSG